MKKRIERDERVNFNRVIFEISFREKLMKKRIERCIASTFCLKYSSSCFREKLMKKRIERVSGATTSSLSPCKAVSEKSS